MKQTFHIFWNPKESWQEESKAVLVEPDMRRIWPERPYGGTVEVEFGEPPAKKIFIAAEISKYEREISDHTAAITVLEGKIQSLLCIEHKPEEA